MNKSCWWSPQEANELYLSLPGFLNNLNNNILKMKDETVTLSLLLEKQTKTKKQVRRPGLRPWLCMMKYLHIDKGRGPGGSTKPLSQGQLTNKKGRVRGLSLFNGCVIKVKSPLKNGIIPATDEAEHGKAMIAAWKSVTRRDRILYLHMSHIRRSVHYLTMQSECGIWVSVTSAISFKKNVTF